MAVSASASSLASHGASTACAEREREREKDERGGYNIVKSVITDNKFKSQRFDQSARNCACRRKDEKSSSSFTYPISRVVNHKAQLV